MGVSNIITFDAHDPRVQNAIPLSGFDSFMPTYQFLKALVDTVPDFRIDNDHLMVISPDEGAMEQSSLFFQVFLVWIWVCSTSAETIRLVVNGRNPIVAHEFLGDDLWTVKMSSS